MFVKSYNTKLLNSAPYYTQANGLAEPSNKILIKFIKKKMYYNLKNLHKVLSEALRLIVWLDMALRKLLYELVYEQEAILFIEVNLDALKEILKYKVYVARAYNNKVKFTSFQVDLFWKTISSWVKRE